MLYVEVLKKRYNNVGRTFCDAIKVEVRLKENRLWHACEQEYSKVTKARR